MKRQNLNKQERELLELLMNLKEKSKANAVKAEMKMDKKDGAIRTETRRETTEQAISKMLYDYTKLSFVDEVMNHAPKNLRTPQGRAHLEHILGERREGDYDIIDDMLTDVFDSIDVGIKKTVDGLKGFLKIIALLSEEVK